MAAPPANEVFSGSLELTLLGDGYGTRVSVGGSSGGMDSSQSMGFDPFNLAPFIFGPGGDRSYFSIDNRVQGKEIGSHNGKFMSSRSLVRKACVRKKRWEIYRV